MSCRPPFSGLYTSVPLMITVCAGRLTPHARVAVHTRTYICMHARTRRTHKTHARRKRRNGRKEKKFVRRMRREVDPSPPFARGVVHTGTFHWPPVAHANTRGKQAERANGKRHSSDVRRSSKKHGAESRQACSGRLRFVVCLFSLTHMVPPLFVE